LVGWFGFFLGARAGLGLGFALVLRTLGDQSRGGIFSTYSWSWVMVGLNSLRLEEPLSRGTVRVFKFVH